MAKLLERGDIYFFYEPKRGVRQVSGPGDVNRLYLVLSGDQAFGRTCRLLALEEAVLPFAQPEERRKSLMGHVAAVSRRPEDMETALARRRVGEAPTPAHPGSVHRPAGEGRYALVEHDGHADLDYVLELPGSPGAVQRDLGIVPSASLRLERYEAGEAKPALEPAALHEGTDLALEAEAPSVPEDVKAELLVQTETPGTAEIFAELKLGKTEYPTEPLYRGEWR